jgi:hypothetical protein
MNQLKNRIYFFGSVLFLCLSVQANSKLAPSREEILKKYSYEQLQSVANYFSSRLLYPKKKILKCDVSLKKTKLLLSGPLRSLIDEQKKAVENNYKANLSLLQGPITECAKTCQCSGYYAILDELDQELSDNDIHKENFKNLKLEIAKQTQKKELSCSMKLQWFCKSSLLRYLEN